MRENVSEDRTDVDARMLASGGSRQNGKRGLRWEMVVRGVNVKGGCGTVVAGS